MAPLSGGDLQGGDGGPWHVLSSIHNEGGENQLQSFRHMWNGAMIYIPLFVTDTTDGVCVKKIARCKFLQI